MSVISRVTLQEMISEVRRELLQRAVVYSRLLAKGEMEADVAKRRNTCMNAVLATLEHLREIERAKKGSEVGDATAISQQRPDDSL